MSPIGPIVMAAGGALLIAGFSIGGVALAQDGDFAARCPDRSACDASLQADYDGARALATAGDALWIAGALTAAAGLVLTFVLTDTADSPSASLRCGPVGCAASVRGTF